MSAEPAIAPAELEAIRRSRRRPRWSQFDYLHAPPRRRPRGRAPAECRTRFATSWTSTAAAVRTTTSSRGSQRRRARRRREPVRRRGRRLGRVPAIRGRVVRPRDVHRGVPLRGGPAARHRRDPARPQAGRQRADLDPAGLGVQPDDPRAPLHGARAEGSLGGWDDVEVVENGGRVVAWATLTATARAPPHARSGRIRRRARPALALGAATCS